MRRVRHALKQASRHGVRSATPTDCNMRRRTRFRADAARDVVAKPKAVLASDGAWGHSGVGTWLGRATCLVALKSRIKTVRGDEGAEYAPCASACSGRCLYARSDSGAISTGNSSCDGCGGGPGRRAEAPRAVRIH